MRNRYRLFVVGFVCLVAAASAAAAANRERVVFTVTDEIRTDAPPVLTVHATLLDPAQQPAGTFGGTGAYQRARGSVRVIQGEDGVSDTRLVFHLLQ